MLVSRAAEVALDYIDVRSSPAAARARAVGTSRFRRRRSNSRSFVQQAGLVTRPRGAAGARQRRDHPRTDCLARAGACASDLTCSGVSPRRCRRERSTRELGRSGCRFPVAPLTTARRRSRRSASSSTRRAKRGAAACRTVRAGQRRARRPVPLVPDSRWFDRTRIALDWRGCSSRALPRSGARAHRQHAACSIASSCGRTS